MIASSTHGSLPERPPGTWTEAGMVQNPNEAPHSDFLQALSAILYSRLSHFQAKVAGGVGRSRRRVNLPASNFARKTGVT